MDQISNGVSSAGRVHGWKWCGWRNSPNFLPVAEIGPFTGRAPGQPQSPMYLRLGTQRLRHWWLQWSHRDRPDTTADHRIRNAPGTHGCRPAMKRRLGYRPNTNLAECPARMTPQSVNSRHPRRICQPKQRGHVSRACLPGNLRPDQRQDDPPRRLASEHRVLGKPVRGARKPTKDASYLVRPVRKGLPIKTTTRQDETLFFVFTSRLAEQLPVHHRAVGHGF